MADDQHVDPADHGSLPRTSLRLRIRQQPQSPNSDSPQKLKKPSSQSSREYRQRLKENPDLYDAHKKYENTRVKMYMTQISEEKREHYREKTRLRVQKHRMKMKAEGQVKNSKVKTRAEKEKHREGWKKQKQMQHANETPEQRSARNARRRKLYAEKQEMKQKMQNEGQTTANSTAPTSTYKTSEALRKATYRAKKSLPRDRGKTVDVIAKLVSSATPTKKQLLRERLIVSPNAKKRLDFASQSLETLKQSLVSLKSSRNTKDLNRKRAIASALVKKYTFRQCRQIDIGYKLFSKVKRCTSPSELNLRKKRKDATGEAVKTTIQNFYRHGEISRSLPDARGVKKQQNGKLMSRMVMERSIGSAYLLFKEQHPDLKIGCSLFAQLRPNDVMPSTSCRRRDCLCEVCANMDLKLEAIRLFAAKNSLENITFQDRYDISRQTLCLKGDKGEYQRACLERKCVLCGTSAVEAKLRPLLETHSSHEMLFRKWTNITTPDNRRRLTRKQIVMPAWNFVEGLLLELQPFSKHLFDASWQGRQYELVTTNVPDGHVIICQDYAENFKCQFQDEAQGAHWSQTSVTLHASVASYRCRKEGCDLMTQETAIFISDDQKHDTHAIHQFNRVLMDHLMQTQNVEKVIFFSDGAPGQYKNKTTFADLSRFKKDFGIPAERHFFGTRHGKGPCDREFGTLKRAVGQAIKNRQAELDSAEDFFEFAQRHYTRPAEGTDHVHYKRKFFLVPEKEVDRNRGWIEDLKPVQNTRQQHAFKMVEPFVIAYRERSCFCNPCLGGEGECLMSDSTGAWNVVSLLKRGTLQGDCRVDNRQVHPELADVDPEPPNNQEADIHPLLSTTASDECPGLGRVLEEPAEVLEEPADHVKQPVTFTNRIQTGSWVKVRFATKHGDKFYHGMVISHDEDKREAEIKYLKCRGTYYVFPEKDDVSWASYEDLAVLMPPDTNSRLQLFFQN